MRPNRWRLRWSANYTSARSKGRLPAGTGNSSNFEASGALLYYGSHANLVENYRQAASYIDRILKARSRARCRSSCRPASGSSSTSRLPRRSATILRVVDESRVEAENINAPGKMQRCRRYSAYSRPWENSDGLKVCLQRKPRHSDGAKLSPDVSLRPTGWLGSRMIRSM